jgi:hypothetical protein
MSRTPARFGSCIGPSVQTPMKQAQAGWFDPPLLIKSGDNGKEQEQHPGADFTSAWRAILDGLRESNPVDGFSVERWQALIADSERFLARWGARALQLGWTELDLFGVHPEGPLRAST